MNLAKINVVESVEEVVETKKVTATFTFDFIDGQIQDEEVRAFYEAIAPKAELVEEEETENEAGEAPLVSDVY